MHLCKNKQKIEMKKTQKWLFMVSIPKRTKSTTIVQSKNENAKMPKRKDENVK
jgi:hypothetical protein